VGFRKEFEDIVSPFDLRLVSCWVVAGTILHLEVVALPKDAPQGFNTEDIESGAQRTQRRAESRSQRAKCTKAVVPLGKARTMKDKKKARRTTHT
jgi:hypothetical protein